MGSAAALLTRHVFLDVETTGLDARTDDVIEVGALFVEGGREVLRLERRYAARRPLPRFIRRLTGLSDADLAGRPPLAADVALWREALAGWTVVAHNAPFERAFLAPVFAGLEADAGAPPPVLCSLELLHYLHPELPSHSLEALLAHFGLPARTHHRALSDCEATRAVVLAALEGCAREGRADDVGDLLSTLDPRARGGLLLAQLEAGEAPDAAAPPPEQAALLALLTGLHAQLRAQVAPFALTAPGFRQAPAARRRAPAHAPPPAAARREADEERPLLPVTPAEVDGVLGAGGALERAEGAFRARGPQLEMARAVARTLSEGGRLAVEAGTGTGKSLAYLAPAALFAARNGVKVAVAPHTKTLQDQLMEKDLPRLHRALGGAFGYALLKGQTNYVCRRRALDATLVEPGMGHAQRAPRAYLRAFLRRSPDGDLDRLSHWFRERFPALHGLVPAVRSEAATTLGERCPHFHRCAYHTAVAQAREADVLVVNQALAFAWPPRYPKLEHLVLDEAHEAEDVATQALSLELSGGALQRLSERLRGRDGRRGVFSELRRALAASRRAEARAAMSEVEAALSRALERGARLAERVAALCEAEARSGSDAEADGDAPYAPEVWVTDGVRAGPAWAPVREGLEAAAAAFTALHRLLVVDVPALLPDLAVRAPPLERELAGAAGAVLELGQLCDELAGTPAPGRCYSAAWDARREAWSLTAAPLDVRGFVGREFAGARRALVLTSATLGTGRAGAPWVLRRLGLAGLPAVGDAEATPPTELLRAPSPFQLGEQALVVLVTDAPRPHDAAFVDWAAGRVAGLAQALGGRVLGLFASARRMERVAEAVEARLAPVGIEVLRQSRGHGRSLAARQERDAGSVLMGTKSFWQGVDIPGLGVACVFIDKLPLEPATRPLVAAREERLARASGPRWGFLSYRLPRALLLLRQGVGRLVRGHADRGVVVVADPGHAGYRALLLEALEGYRVEALPWAEARVRVHQALGEMGLLAAQAGAPVAEATADPAAPGRVAS